MDNLPFEIIRLIRPLHWVKNLAIFAALIFSGKLFVHLLIFKVFWAFMAFNLAASATYAFNDILDAKKDRLHPTKRNRPVAKGTVTPALALGISLCLAFTSLTIASSLSDLFFLTLATYLAIQIAYSTALKNLYVIDILIIASGFVMRVYSGAFVIDAHLSVWFLLCVISIALFLASGKRRSELGIIETPGKTRASLAKYSRELLNSYVTMFGNAAWMSWALFTFFESPRTNVPLWTFLAELSKATTVDKLLMSTIPVSIFGIMRYQSLIFEGRSEAPEKVLLTDKSLVASVVLWAGMVVWILYGGFSTS